MGLTGVRGTGLCRAIANCLGELPQQAVPAAPDGRTPWLRQLERDQLGWHAATIDDPVARDYPVRAVWAFVQGLDLKELHDAVKAREGDRTRRGANSMTDIGVSSTTDCFFPSA